jgi:prevent-host-death family protein
VASVGVYEAKTQLPRLLDQVARGKKITITRHGVPVAMLVPATDRPIRPVKDVIADLRAFRKGRRLGVSIREAIAEGRR